MKLRLYSYIKKEILGEGTYAKIYRALVTDPQCEKFAYSVPTLPVPIREVAIKQIKRTKYSVGHEISAVREIKTLQKVSSPYVLELLDVFIHRSCIHLVLECVHTNLERIIRNKDVLIMPSDIKAWILMLLRGLLEFHNAFMIHRDIKPNNILIKADGTVKIADFGLTRKISNNMTPQAVTRWYRAPELLFGARNYSYALDIWSVGCVFTELFLRVPLFAAESDLQQIDLIFKALGTPTKKDWATMETLPGYVKMQNYPKGALRNLLSAVDDQCFDLISRMLTFDPCERIACIEALRHDYFKISPMPTPIGKFNISF